MMPGKSLVVPACRIGLVIAVTGHATTSVGAPLMATDGEQSGRSTADRIIDQMFRRDQPRGFSRYPEQVDEYLRAYGGLYLQLSLTSTYQKASSSTTDRDDLLTNSYHFTGAWRAVPNGQLSWWLAGGNNIDPPSSANLSEDIGSILDVNGNRESDALYLSELYWSQIFAGKLRYSLGLIEANQRYDFNVSANDDQSNFLSSPLINSPVIPFPPPGLSADLLWKPMDTAAVHLGFYQANCATNGDCLKALNKDEFFSPIELIYRTSRKGLGEGNYRFMGFYSRNGQNHGYGYSISIDQALGPVTPFIRYSAADKKAGDIERFFSAGFELPKPFTRSWDGIGVGYAIGWPSDHDKRSEKIVELYWRFQLIPYLSLTPDIQWIIDPANNPDKDQITVAGLRLQLDF